MYGNFWQSCFLFWSSSSADVRLTHRLSRATHQYNGEKNQRQYRDAATRSRAALAERVPTAKRVARKDAASENDDFWQR